MKDPPLARPRRKRRQSLGSTVRCADLRHLPDPCENRVRVSRKDPAQIRSTARTLCQCIDRDLAKLDAGMINAGYLKTIYDKVHLPRLMLLGVIGAQRIEGEEWDVLGEPLHPDLAATQLRIVRELIHRLTVAAF